MLLQELIAENNHKGATVYVAFLDIRKAFDTVWIQGLLYKLYKAGLRDKPWRLICDSYTNYQCAVSIGGQPGSWFYPERGVHQGAPLSMPLYQVYINELLVQLRNNPYSAYVGKTKIGSPTFADDIASAVLYKPGLNSILMVASLYSIKWKFEFSVDKSLAMIWGTDRMPDLKIMMGDAELKVVNQCKHMGIRLISDCNKMPRKMYMPIGSGLVKGPFLQLEAWGAHGCQCPLRCYLSSTGPWPFHA